MGIFDPKRRGLIAMESTPKYNVSRVGTDLDKQLDRIAKKTMQDYKQVFKKLEKY
jgi:hypothetical protein